MQADDKKEWSASQAGDTLARCASQADDKPVRGDMWVFGLRQKLQMKQ
jgi:hypothetical protein